MQWNAMEGFEEVFLFGRRKEKMKTLIRVKRKGSKRSVRVIAGDMTPFESEWSCDGILSLCVCTNQLIKRKLVPTFLVIRCDKTAKEGIRIKRNKNNSYAFLGFMAKGVL